MTNKKLKLIAGPCAIEDEKTPFLIANYIKSVCDNLGIEYIFKGSWRKANRTSLSSFSGINRMEALDILKNVGSECGVPVLTDIHESSDADMVAEYVDYLQIPAFLCRQTDLLLAAGSTGLPVNIKKGQFVSPEAMEFAMNKVYSTGNKNVLLTERGTTFGYNNLVVDFTSVPRMRSFCNDVIVDCTHCLQIPNQSDGVTGGNPDMIGVMASAAIAVGADGLFIETHPDPASAKSDSSTMLQLDKLSDILTRCMRIRHINKDL